jgi:hypothetical protein
MIQHSSLGINALFGLSLSSPIFASIGEIFLGDLYDRNDEETGS